MVKSKDVRMVRPWNGCEAAHDIFYNNTYATSEDSDQPAHPRSLIRIFADRMCLLQTLGYQKKVGGGGGS